MVWVPDVCGVRSKIRETGLLQQKEISAARLANPGSARGSLSQNPKSRIVTTKRDFGCQIVKTELRQGEFIAKSEKLEVISSCKGSKISLVTGQDNSCSDYAHHTSGEPKRLKSTSVSIYAISRKTPGVCR
jgi:hypothetical protein